MKITCPKCNKSLQAKEEIVGKMARCPSCKSTFRVPSSPPPTQGPTESPSRPASPVVDVQAVAEMPQIRTTPVPGDAAASGRTGYQQSIRAKYWWLFIPLLSWIGLVFPLILPPIPIGPIMISLSWNRREWMPHIQQAMKLLLRKPKQYGFPLGWLVNVFVNIGDFVTLGLTHLLITAELLSALDKKYGKQEDEMDAVAWVFKWLALGNVAFLAVYVAWPGYIFEHLLTRLERHFARSAGAHAVSKGQGLASPAAASAGRAASPHCPICNATLPAGATRCLSPSCDFVLPENTTI